jgi:hypothetical protein
MRKHSRKPLDLAGKRFGRLTAIKRVGTRLGHLPLRVRGLRFQGRSVQQIQVFDFLFCRQEGGFEGVAG